MNAVDFPPPRQRGVTIHATLIAVLAAIAGLMIWLATRQPVGLVFTVFIIAGAAAFLPLPVLIYRLWSLLRARYLLDRNSLTITWGLRVESIPTSDVEWVRSLKVLKERLRLPAFILPGSVLGARSTPNLGNVEFLASDSSSLLLVATRKGIYAISPSDSQAFLQNIQRAIEMGSLSPAEPQSVYPAFVIADAWKSSLARFLWLTGLFLNIGMLAWVSLLIASLQNIPLGFLPSGEAGEIVPVVGLILLPGVSSTIAFAGWVAGLFFFRREQQRLLAFLLWGNCVLTSLLFLVAVLFIINTPV